ncbi:DUF305 domain-containing protein [Entomobacter blattae]|uniref:DUF305 domain-containing protein n=1 Tax=Entomobacter blattae TaxID=2762277 RepID=A0A7H1NR94_9PROT|nr:DUF305 domain-containing protein [Entomobacter blattae]QNT78304.1 hypothetical protein JGUZn3_10760 [Entomobacter blattae]
MLKKSWIAVFMGLLGNIGVQAPLLAAEGGEQPTSMKDSRGVGLQGERANQVDIAFVRGMITHHEMALRMAREELEKGQNAQMRQLATAIIQTQKKEIDRMQQWLKVHSSSKANTPSNTSSSTP